jgi:predicted acylesterase/phospholipase RssA
MSTLEDGGGVLEHRLAVVMNGGVSLAVWMGGVAREMDNLRRASLGLPFQATPGISGGRSTAERALFELWGKHASEKKFRLTVDVIAGTSAGGLNGVLLAMAIAHGVPLSGLRELWMQAAQLSDDALLKPQDGGSASVLNGKFFLDQVAGAMDTLRAGSAGDSADVALTVTSTALGGGARFVRDSAGARFMEADHRRRYEFRHVKEHVKYTASAGADPFTTELIDDFATVGAVALAGRASASYPAAFAPVCETPKLREYRSWPAWAAGTQMDWLADGGILDNSPFEPVLEAIADRPVDSTWHRTLCFVVPSADEADLGREIGPPREVSSSPPWTSVIKSAIGLPREADFRDDVEQLHGLIRGGRSSYDVKRFGGLIASIGKDTFAEALELAAGALQLYRQSRAAAGVYEIRDAVARPGAYLDPVTDVDPEAVLAASRPWLPDEFPRALPPQWTWGLAAADRTVAVMLRTLAQDSGVADDVRAALSGLKQKIAAVRVAVINELSSGALPTEGPEAVGAAAALADRIYAELDIPARLAALVNEAAATFAAATLGDEALGLQVLQAALCIEVINGAGGVPAETKQRPIFDFIRMGISEAPQVLETAVASALAGTGGGAALPPSNILYGTRLSHFAAFGRKEWRAWDWMWGRLHAAMHLGRLLELSPDEIDEIVKEIAVAEDTSIDEVNHRIAEVVKASSEELIATIEADGLLPAAADAVLALLGSTVVTSPPVPGPVRGIGGWAYALSARRPTGLSIGKKALRGLLAIPRWYMWRRLTRSRPGKRQARG